jgi:hypothetical protein
MPLAGSRAAWGPGMPWRCLVEQICPHCQAVNRVAGLWFVRGEHARKERRPVVVACIGCGRDFEALEAAEPVYVLTEGHYAAL